MFFLFLHKITIRCFSILFCLFIAFVLYFFITVLENQSFIKISIMNRINKIPFTLSFNNKITPNYKIFSFLQLFPLLLYIYIYKNTIRWCFSVSFSLFIVFSIIFFLKITKWCFSISFYFIIVFARDIFFFRKITIRCFEVSFCLFVVFVRCTFSQN